VDAHPVRRWGPWFHNEGRRPRGCFRPARPVRHAIPFVVAFVALTSGCVAGRPEATRPTPLPGAALQGMLRQHAERHDAGVIALVMRDGVIWRGAAGRARPFCRAPHCHLAGTAEGRPAEARDCFDIASIGKSLVATVTLQLVDEGRLSLEDSVERWLPRLEGGRRVLVRYLLNHTSGLTPKPSGGLTVAFAPGSTWAYSNLGYGVLGNLLAEVGARHLGEEIRDRILVPLGLVDGRAGSGAWLGSSPEGHPCGPISTTSDLARFFQGLLGGDLLDEDMLAEIMTTVPAYNEFHSGLGIFRADMPCGSAWGNGGDSGFYATQVLASRDGSTIVVVARNVGDWASVMKLAERMYCEAI